MTLDIEDLLNSIVKSFGKMNYIQADDIPNIDLYMDQVTTFMDDRLKPSTRYKAEEKLMTKTMINNYAKNDVIPPPIRKKYTKDHLFILIMIFYFKSILQISDIKELMDPIVENFFGKNSDFGIDDVYTGIFEDKGEELKAICEDVVKQYEECQDKFEDAPEDERDYLKLYAFVCKLGCDVFVKKLMIEKIVDSLKEHKEEKSGSSKDNKYDVTVDKKGKK